MTKRFEEVTPGTRGILALADGRTFTGTAFGAARGRDNPQVGETVFNTSMYGYQEILTDPSYAGQMMCFTAPHIGNVGCNDEDNESSKVHVEGVIVRELSASTSNFRAEESFAAYLARNGVMGLTGVDTRELTAHIRDTGAQMGAMGCGDDVSADELIERARAAGSMLGKDYVHAVTCDSPYAWKSPPWTLGSPAARTLPEERLAARPHVVALDCGVKRNILRLLLGVGFRVTVVPADYSAEQIRELKPDGLFLSNGPGDPAALQGIVQAVKGVIGEFPIFGICLGHQILGQAFGGKTYKLKFGHRGGNHPVKDHTTGKVEITVQNHGFAVDSATLPKEIEVSHVNLNDGTVEGLIAPAYRVFSVQYHPEASPGPHDAAYLFRRFFESVVQS